MSECRWTSETEAGHPFVGSERTRGGVRTRMDRTVTQALCPEPRGGGAARANELTGR